jgi:hypothetical protein
MDTTNAPPSRPISAAAAERLGARRLRVTTIRRRILAAGLASFAIAWGTIAATGSMGATSAATSGTGAVSAATASYDTSGSDDSSTYDSSSSSSSSSASSSGSGTSGSAVSPVTTQSS